MRLDAVAHLVHERLGGERLLALADGLVGEDEHRELELLGDVEGVDGRVEAVLDVGAGEDDARRVAVRAEEGLQEVGLLALRRVAGRGPAALHVDDDRGTSAIEARPIISIISERPGPDVAVMDFTPAKDAPMMAPIAASSSSVWTTEPPARGSHSARKCRISEEGVIG